VQVAEPPRERPAAPGRPPVRRGLRYKLAGPWELGAIEDGVWRTWTGVVRAGRVRGWRFTATGLAAGAVVIAAVRAIVTLGTGAGTWWARVPALLAAAAALAGVTALMLRWYVRHRADQDDLFPVLSAVVLAVVAAGLTLVTFAGVATVVWDAGWASVPHGSADPAYSLVELSYLRTLAGSVPVLALPDRFGWADPLRLTGLGPNLVRLGYQFMLLVPLIRVAQAGYAAAKSRWARAYDRQAAMLALVRQDLAERPEWISTPAISSGAGAVRASSLPLRYRWTGLDPGQQVTLAALAIAAVVGSSYLPRLPGLVHGWWHAPAAEFPAAWAARVLPWLLAAWLVHRWWRAIPRHGRNLIGEPLSTVTVISLAWIVQIIAAGAAVLGLLVRGGIVAASPASGAGLLEHLAWQVADAMPGPSITGVMHWSRPGTERGALAALVEVAVLLSVLALLSFPVGLAVHVWSQRAVRWRDPDQPDSERAAEVALSAAAGGLRAADQAVRDLAALVQRQRRLWFWVQRYMSYPWVDATDRFIPAIRGGLAGRLFPAERQLIGAVAAAERALKSLPDTPAALAAAGVGQVQLKAYDAAAAAVRRHYLYLDAGDSEHVPGFPTAGHPPPQAVEALDRVNARAADAVAGFAVLLRPPVGHEHLPWQEAPVTVLGERIARVPAAELLETVTSEQFRLRWDFTVRMPLVLAALATRPAAETATFMAGLLAAERDDLKKRAPAPRGRQVLPGPVVLTWQREPERPAQATRRLAGLIHDQGAQRVAEIVAALLASPGTVGPAGERSPSVVCAGFLLEPYHNEPVPAIMRMFILLSDAGCAEFAMGELFRWRLHSAREMIDALDMLSQAGRDDLRVRVLSVAARWRVTMPGGFLSDGWSDGDFVRLIRILREDGVPPAELLSPLGQNVPRSAALREQIATELRQSALDENQWQPLL